MKLAAWSHHLVQHPDKEFVRYIMEGLCFGFRLGFDHVRYSCVRARGNMASTRQDSNLVSSYLDEERSLGRVIGPLDIEAFPIVQCSPMGLVPKGSSGKWRLIVDLSSPEGSSVNDGIDPTLCSLEYVTVDVVAKVAVQLGKGAFLSKVDIRSAYRTIPVHPDDRFLLGMCWEGRLFVDTVLPFGLRSAPKIFTAVADAVEWIARANGVGHLFHYLDDFLLVSEPSVHVGLPQLSTLLRIFDTLGLPVAEEKLEGPSTVVTFLGIEVDTVAMELRLPQRKVSELKILVKEWLGRHSCRKKELQSLVGKLQHACRVVKPGRSFLQRVIELLAAVKRDFHHVRLNASFRSDLVWWDTFLEGWNETSFLTDRRDEHSARFQLYSDASGGFGCGAHWNSEWLQFEWPEGWGGRNITLKEIVPVVFACATWGSSWRGALVTAHIDNTAAVAILNSGYSKEGQIMHLVRCLFFIMAHFQFSLVARHIPGSQNKLADAISRNNLQSFLSQSQEANPVPAIIHEALVQLLITAQPDWTSPSWSRFFRSCLQQD